MGNQFGPISDDDSGDEIGGFDLIHLAVNAIDLDLRSPNCFPSTMPVIRNKPNLKKFQDTDMFREVKARSSMCTKDPDEWNLLNALQKRENGLASPGNDSFSMNQQRSIANTYIPNQKTSRLMSLESKVFITKFNKDGSKLLTACKDGYVRVYDGSKGTYHLLNRIHARDVHWSIIDADFSPNGTHFAYSTWSRSFFIMPLNGGENDCQWIDVDTPSDRVAIFSLRYSPSGDKIIGGSNNASIIVGDVHTRSTQILRTHRLPVTDVNAVSYVNDYDPNVIIGGCDDGLIKLFDLRTAYRHRTLAKSVASFIGHYDGITYIDSRNDGNYILTNSKDQSIKIWDLRQPSNTRVRGSSRQQPLQQVSWDYRWDRVPRDFYNPHKALDGDSSVMTYRGHRVCKTLLRAKFSPLEQTGQRYIYTGCATGRIIIYDILTGKIRQAIEGHKNVIRDLDWHPLRSEIVSGSWDMHVHLNSYNRNMAIQTLKRRRSSPHYDNKPLRRSRRLANRIATPD